ncbi:MAG: hypothetical protein ACOZF0_14730 [Thermodesulfobacteriota bacterium]
MTPPLTTTPRGIRLILMAVPPAMGLLALLLGQDASWDLRNYHFYNPFAFLTGRMGYDVGPAQVATYYNPLMHLPFYFAVTNLPPRLVAFGLGCLQGTNIFLLYGIAVRMIGPSSDSRDRWLCLITAILGILGATNIAETGTSYGDNLLSIPVLFSLFLIMDRFHRLGSPGSTGLLIAAAAGLAAGCAAGLKQPFAVYAVGMCLAFFGLSLPLKRRFELAFCFGLGVLAGMALTGGFWLLEMWRRYANPLFPYFNQFFRSSWGSPESYRDMRFLSSDPLIQLLFPVWINLNPLQVGEVAFRDLRLSILYVLLIILLGKKLVQPGKQPAVSGDAESTSRNRFLLLFVVVSFLIWMKLFSVYRYIIICDFLAPLTILAVLGMLVAKRDRQVRLALGCFIVILALLVPGDWGRRPFSSDYFGVRPPALGHPSNTLVLSAGYDPMAYMIPFFPPEVRFLRIHSYLTGPSAHPNGLDEQMRAIVREHSGDMYLLVRSYEKAAARRAVQFHGLEIDDRYCRTFTPHVEPQQEHPFCFCPVVKTAGAGPPPSVKERG